MLDAAWDLMTGLVAGPLGLMAAAFTITTFIVVAYKAWKGEL